MQGGGVVPVALVAFLIPPLPPVHGWSKHVIAAGGHPLLQESPKRQLPAQKVRASKLPNCRPTPPFTRFSAIDYRGACGEGQLRDSLRQVRTRLEVRVRAVEINQSSRS